ncbi:hypothetical protein M9978_12735 [Sphingomonas sp. MG17]|uniref:Uncharacterized protein n=1 Tax=Sphingomonas tagetis TaxID=2949092 RepID=A0A9X2HL96_9SPHN|nr:hypothetical protein [Sphingomonas tagetis]MCP3731294.1 hypothetical protein [Sphingomonas tagetis]
MQFLAAIIGMLVSVPPLIFFWIGTGTFVRPSERRLAVIVTLVSAALLALSAVLFFTRAVQAVQGTLLAVQVLAVSLILLTYRKRR